MTRPGGSAAVPRRTLWGMSGYQWGVLFAAWLGWGFDVFDGLLFNFVAPNCVPTLLGLTIGSPEARAATLRWTGGLTSVLLVGWALGGIFFGRVADRIGRTRTLMLTMLLYALGTALCAVAPNLWVLAAFRMVSSFGIGGEWAAGAAMVAEVVPERRRVEAGALLYTSAPVGLFLASVVNFRIAGVWLHDRPEISWRVIFLSGLLPAAVALLVRKFVREPERWERAVASVRPGRLRELFDRDHRRLTLSGFLMALTALVMWWSCNAFIPVVASGLAQVEAQRRGLDRSAMLGLVESWKSMATSRFNWGGLLGTLLTVPAAKTLGRRAMFGLYFALSSVALFATSTWRRKRGSECTSGSAFRSSASSAASPTTCRSSFRPACAAPARASATTSGGFSPPAVRCWSARSRRAAPRARCAPSSRSASCRSPACSSCPG